MTMLKWCSFYSFVRNTRFVADNTKNSKFGTRIISLGQTPLICNTVYQRATRSFSTVTASEPSLRISEKEDKVHPAGHYVKVPDRGLLEIHGEDTVKYLQGLITNDMSLISFGGGGFYTAFLNPIGRVMFDAFIHPKNSGTSFPHPTFLVECDSRILPEIIKHMKKYMLRSRVKINDVSSFYQVWNVWGDLIDNLWRRNPKLVEIGCRDLRYHNMGVRLVLPPDTKPEIPGCITALPSNEYTIRRILHGVPEGIHDFPPGETLPLQSNFDYMGGIDFHKGCYIGQELTFRTYHTGVTRKRILPVQLYHEGESVPTTLEVDRNSNLVLPPPSSDINILNRKGRPVGSIGTSYHNVALALLKLDIIQGNELTVNNGQGENLRIKPFRPQWWPKIDDKENIQENQKDELKV
ncbi:8751_t:CDS:2 [Funneliformis caledonium]|uniref:8751_t:CDS:1 n=1 Tax=Funneliformis caledonium TaxID=1117310 RepID=A0A9N9F837_9GLOM|nr:8751_t:CDS:2 [Funneliformis caledonium]